MTGRTYARPLDAVDELRSTASDTGWNLRVRKTVRGSDPYMAGHFPGLILYPAVFLLETVRQSVAEATRSTWGGWLELAGIRQLRLVKPMLEGYELDLDIAVSVVDGELLTRATAKAADELVAEITVALVRGGRTVEP